VVTSPLLAVLLAPTNSAALSPHVFRDVLLQLLVAVVAVHAPGRLSRAWVQRYTQAFGQADCGAVLLIV
jgi:predicted Na+-dependent transporter